MQKVLVKISIICELDKVFDSISDHEKFLSGGGMKCTLLKEGSVHRNGVGAIREVKTIKLTLFERITEFEPKLRYSYLIESTKPSYPLKHDKGWLDFTYSDGKTHIDWHSHFKITTPIIGPIIGFFVKKQLAKIFQSRLEYAKKNLELN